MTRRTRHIRGWKPSRAILPLVLLLAGCGSGGGGGENAQGAGPSGVGGPTLAVEAASLVEGGPGARSDLLFRVSLDAPAAVDIAFDYATSALTAVSPSDFTTATGTMQVLAGETEVFIPIEIVGDDRLEPDEVFTLSLSNLTGPGTWGADSAQGTIENDDVPRLAIESPELEEGDSGTRALDFLVKLEAPTGDLQFDYEIVDRTTTAGTDYLVPAGPRTVTLAAGLLSTRISLEIVGDLDAEASETVEVQLSNLVGEAIFETDRAVGTILDDDTGSTPVSTASVSSQSTLEGGDGSTTPLVFTVVVDPPSPSPVEIAFETRDDSATQGDADYTSTTGTVVVPANAAGESFTVDVLGDDDVEDLERFFVDLRLVSGSVTLATSTTTGFIVNDDSTFDGPEVSMSDPRQLEGDSGLTDMIFEITLSKTDPAPVTLSYTTEEDEALAGADFEPRSGTVQIAPGDTNAFVSIPIVGDTSIEGDERFFVRMSNLSSNARFIDSSGWATILTDDPLARISIEGASREEGDSATAEIVFTARLDEVVDDDVEFSFTTGEETATEDEDYVATTGVASIPAGSTETRIVISILGDLDPEPDEIFLIELHDPSTNAAIDVAVARGSILNDDGDPGWGDPELAHAGNIGPSARLARAPDVARVPGLGHRIVFNQELTIGRQEIQSRFSPGAGVWDPAESVGAAIAPTTAPRVAAAPFDEGVVLYAGAEPMASERDGGAFQVPVAIDTRSFDRDLELAQSPTTGEAVATWVESASTSDDGVTGIRAARFVPGSGWDAAESVETLDTWAYDPSVGVAASGDAIIAFSQAPASPGVADVVAYHATSGGSWRGPFVLDDLASDTARAPRIDMDAAGNAVVAWIEDVRPYDTLAFALYDAAADRWSDPREVERFGALGVETFDVALGGGGEGLLRLARAAGRPGRRPLGQSVRSRDRALRRCRADGGRRSRDG